MPNSKTPVASCSELTVELECPNCLMMGLHPTDSIDPRQYKLTDHVAMKLEGQTHFRVRTKRCVLCGESFDTVEVSAECFAALQTALEFETIGTPDAPINRGARRVKFGRNPGTNFVRANAVEALNDYGMKIIGATLLESETRPVKFILGPDLMLIFPATNQHRDMRLDSAFYEDDSKGNAVAGLVMADHVEMRTHRHFTPERIGMLWKSVVSCPEMSALVGLPVTYGGKPL